MKRIQNRIAESRFALPVTTLYAIVAWLAGGLVSKGLYAEFAAFAVSAYLMVELNNRNSLIRIYSRMVSCSFLVIATMAFPVYGSIDDWLVGLCFAAAYLVLFSAYQDKHAQGKMFYAFMFIGIASLIFVQALFFVPVICVLTATNLMAFSSRNLWASLIGLSLPYWFYIGYCAITGNTAYAISHFAPDVWFAPLWQYDCLSISQILVISFIAVVTATGAVHFMRNSYKDKIRTRMIYEFIITMSVLTFIFMALQPQHAGQLTGILTINASILTAHFFALTSTRITNIAFCVLTLAAVGITVFNLFAGNAF